MDKNVLFKNFITHLNNTKIEYCILGNVESYFEKITSDIDFFVAKSLLKNINTHVIRFALNNNLKLVRQNNYAVGGITFVLGFVEKNNIETISFDFCINYNKFLRILISENEIKQHIVFDNTYECYRLDKLLSFKYYNTKKICKGMLTYDQFQYLKILYESLDPAEQTSVESNLNYNGLLKYIKDNDYTKYSSSINFFRKQLIRSNHISLGILKKEIARVANRIKYPEGRIIEINKTISKPNDSSLLDSLLSNLSGVYKNEIVYVKMPKQNNKSSLWEWLDKLKFTVFKLYPGIIRGNLIITTITPPLLNKSIIVFKIESHLPSDPLQTSLQFICKMNERNLRTSGNHF